MDGYRYGSSSQKRTGVCIAVLAGFAVIAMLLVLLPATVYGDEKLSQDGDVISCALTNEHSKQTVSVTPSEDGEYVFISSKLTGTNDDAVSAKLTNSDGKVTASGFARIGSRFVAWGDNNTLEAGKQYTLSLESYGSVSFSLMMARYDGSARYHSFRSGAVSLTEGSDASSAEVVCTIRPEDEGQISWSSTDKNVVSITATTGEPLIVNRMQEKYMYCWSADFEGVQDGTAEIQLKNATTGKILHSVPVTCTGFPVIPVGYGVYVGGVEVNSENFDPVIGASSSGKVSYDPDKHILTLADATITRSGFTWLDSKCYPVAAIGGSGSPGMPLKINLVGKNVIEDVSVPASVPAGTGAYEQYSYEASLEHNGIEGIHVNGSVVFTGTGSLRLTDSRVGTGISCDDMTIDKGASVSLDISHPRSSYGVRGDNAVTVNGALSVNTFAQSNNSYAVQTKKLVVGAGGSFTADAGCGSLFKAQALTGARTITLADGVTMKAGAKTSSAYTITPNEDIPEPYMIAGKNLSIKIRPASLKSVSAGKKKCTVKWNALSRNYADSYQISYSTSSKFTKKTTKTKSISKYSTSKCTLTKLKSKKTYYVRIRTCKKIDGAAKYSAWSSAKKVKIK